VATYAVAGLLGIGLALFVFPLAFLFPVSPAPGPFPDGALAQHAIGQRYFIADAWRRPLLMVPSLGAPHGVNIGLTDSIPLIALILKAFSSWLPPGFHGIGLTLAPETTIPVNTMYEARRHRSPDCDIRAQASAPLPPGEVRVLLPDARSQLSSLIPDSNHAGHDIGDLVACYKD
jgi:hypothetical protein